MGNDGNIGIGKKNPSAILDVNGSFKATSANISETLTANALSATSATISGTLSANTLNVQSTTFTGNAIFNGLVGIKTSNPQALLHLHDPKVFAPREAMEDSTGINREMSNILKITSAGSSGEGFTIHRDPSSPGILIFKQHDNSLIIEGPNGGLEIATNGNILMEKNLEVGGSLSAKSANINGALTANSAEINGKITANSAEINGTIKATIANIMGGLTANSAKINGNVNIYGAITANSAEINGKIKANSAEINGALTANSADIDGELSANSATIKGELTANSATIPTLTGNTKVNGILTANVLKAPSAEIKGKIKAQEIEVTLNAKDWPDFVFENDYTLMNLQEVEQYIKENKHLPAVPSAAEVEENGINLGEMNAILIQKVEELTLYILDLQKQIDELKQTKGGN
jgi:cytoskeletal protein CcmA (bactofilin family)